MKNLDNYITERLKLTGKTEKINYAYYPHNKDELIKILKERLKKDKNADLNDIDVSEITDMSRLFMDLRWDICNIDISKWNVSKVTNMSNMFNLCFYFDCDLSSWDVSKVENMDFMFSGCSCLNCDLSDWNIENVKSAQYMFYKCKEMDCDLSNWNGKNIKNTEGMFDGTYIKKPKWYKR